jgi:E3 ubiquitin-protein ligase RGLG
MLLALMEIPTQYKSTPYLQLIGYSTFISTWPEPIRKIVWPFGDNYAIWALSSNLLLFCRQGIPPKVSLHPLTRNPYSRSTSFDQQTSGFQQSKSFKQRQPAATRRPEVIHQKIHSLRPQEYVTPKYG